MMVGCEWFTGQGNEVEYIKNYQEFSLLSGDGNEFSENLEFMDYKTRLYFKQTDGELNPVC